MDRPTILRTMIIGFVLTVTLVLAAAFIGYRQSREIHMNAQDLVRETLPENERARDLETKLVAESTDLLSELVWTLGMVFALAVGGSLGAIWLTNRALLRLERQTRELNSVSWQLLESQENTARRFSHEMHDELGQALTGLKSMIKRTTAADLEQQRGAMVELLDEAVRDVRELAQLLRPVILDDFGLDAGLRWLTERFSQRTGIEIRYESAFSGRLPDAVETHLFRIAQEALTNIARHSGAGHATVALRAERGEVALRIEDDGRGMDIERPHGGSGMVGIRARVRQLDGKLTFSRVAAGGLRIDVVVPSSGDQRVLNNSEQPQENPHPVS